MATKCPHCRSVDVTDTVIGYRCHQCRLSFTVDGNPARPDKCGACGCDVVYGADDRYTCVGRSDPRDRQTPCGRTSYGPFPTKPGTMIVEPAEGYARANQPGFMPGKHMSEF